MPVAPSQGKLLYHITHLNNLPSIFNYGLHPRAHLTKVSITDIADPDIIHKRRDYEVNLLNYVPFHFFARNPFDGAVCNRYGTENMAIVTIRRPQSSDEQDRFMIIPSHPVGSSNPNIMPYSEGITAVRWDILDMPENRDYHDPSIRKACMAECLCTVPIAPQQFFKVFVSTKDTAEKVRAMEFATGITIEANKYMFP